MVTLHLVSEIHRISMHHCWWSIHKAYCIIPTSTPTTAFPEQSSIMISFADIH